MLVAAVAVMLVASRSWSEPLSTLGVDSSAPWLTMAIGLGLILLITLGNLIAVSRAVRKRFYA